MPPDPPSVRASRALIYTPLLSNLTTLNLVATALLIEHRPSMFEGRHTDYRSSKVDTSITDLRRSTHRSSVFEAQHIHLRRSTHRSSKVDTSISEGRHIVTSIFEGRHIDLRKSTHRSSKVDTSLFESRRIDLRRSKAETSHLQFVVEYCPLLRSKVPGVDEVTHANTYIRTCIKINNTV